MRDRPRGRCCQCVCRTCDDGRCPGLWTFVVCTSNDLHAHHRREHRCMWPNFGRLFGLTVTARRGNGSAGSWASLWAHRAVERGPATSRLVDHGRIRVPSTSVDGTVYYDAQEAKAGQVYDCVRGPGEHGVSLAHRENLIGANDHGLRIRDGCRVISGRLAYPEYDEKRGAVNGRSPGTR